MNLLKLCLSYIKYKSNWAFLTIILFASSLSVMIVLSLLNEQTNKELTKNLQNIDLVVGAKGSPLQLILSSVLHIDIPTGNIPLEEAEKLSQHPMIKKVIPVSLGDNYGGFHIVGTEKSYIDLYKGEISEGRKLWHSPLEVVIGADVAEKSNLKIGDNFYGSHGLTKGGEEHKDAAYIVTGILKRNHTVLDKLILTDKKSIWEVHAHHNHHDEEAQGEHDEHNHHDEKAEDEHEGKEVTALLIQYKSPLAAVMLPRQINSDTDLQAASPAFEMARLISLMGFGVELMQKFGIYLMAIAGFSLFTLMYNAVKERAYDLALMRSLGASKGKLLSLMLTEGLILSLLSVVVGLLVAHITLEFIGIWLMEEKQIYVTGLTYNSEEIYLILTSIFVSLIATFLASLKVYRMNIVELLSKV